jgi:hypothetical protein
MDTQELREAQSWLGGRDLGTLLRVREGTYGAPGQPQVYYEDGDTYKDVTDLYQVLPVESGDGTKHLENAQVEHLGACMLSGYPLSDVQIGVLQALLAKYADAIAALRADQEQDYTNVPDPGTARLVKGTP